MSAKKSRLKIVVIGGVIAVVICAGAATLVVKLGLNAVANDVASQLQTHPKVQEHFGEFESFAVNLTDSGNIDDEETFVYDVEGSKGPGQMIVKSVTVDSGEEWIESAVIKKPDGEIIELDVAILHPSPTDVPAEMPID